MGMVEKIVSIWLVLALGAAAAYLVPPLVRGGLIHRRLPLPRFGKTLTGGVAFAYAVFWTAVFVAAPGLLLVEIWRSW